MTNILVKIFTISFLALFVICLGILLYMKLYPSSKQGRYPVKAEWYPKYHFAPKTGWMNDPNGLIAFDGYYHAFYQHNPYNPFPIAEKIAWGHARSKDMLKWEYLPIAISPSTDLDKNGCFSGSAVLNDGILTLIYTGRSVDKGVERQVQCIATSSDTINFTKQGKVVDPPGTYPDFRDPKVWKQEDSWYMVVSLRDGNIGKVLLYKSPDLRKWEYQRVLASSDENLGYIWECPDFYNLGKKYVLMVSPQGIKPDGYKYRNFYQSGYLVGDWNLGGEFDVEQSFTEVDYGHDFYAPQSFIAPDGRRIMIGWMDMWFAPMPEDKQNWAGIFTLPREMSLSTDNRLRIQPIREIETLRHNPVRITKKVLKKEYVEIDDNVTTMEIITIWNITESDAEKYGLRLGDKGYTEGGLYLYVDNQSKRLVLDRHYTLYGITGYRSFPLGDIELLTLRVFFDRSSMEVFINDGLACMSSRIYPTRDQRSLSIFADNGVATLEDSTRWLL